ncbi:hypothetical protein NEOLEDRAFT_1163117 [Neolentinus lepideus HHB14362 ss-1]|uniref:Brl1/Brr6 domain-containing protein n=1 Tax=Neolentinus lepideus HHB14362 ss-1 TaxID=1314782 RepID=A0A165S4R9_9AGAM|nr:hypothetical protein NEOLEDRAFT_1163117 [Neolentinus lepideus HHB14362 ss-1]
MSLFRSQRSTEAPMDFQFTSRPSSNMKPVWARSEEEGGSPRKRPHVDSNPLSPVFPSTPSRPTFGANNNVPFIFQTPPPRSEPSHPWEPPPNFSPTKAFPSMDLPDVKDVDMAELTPPRSDEQKAHGTGARAIATGAMRRVFKARQKTRERSRLAATRKPTESGDDASDTDSGEEGGERAVRARSPFPQNLSNHYTLNMSAPAPPKSELPYILIGYTQFVFNSALVLIFLYLLVQFILTVQRDVEERISEYSRDIMQEIASCAIQYRNNLCETNPIPAMAHQCATWETCMNRDPNKVGRARVGAELIAEVINGFVEPISWKTLIFVVVSVSFFTVFANTVFNFYLRQYAPVPTSQNAPQPSFPVMPPSQRYYSPAPEWDADKDEPRTPSRRRRLLEGGTKDK